MLNYQSQYSDLPYAKKPLFSFSDWISLLAGIAAVIAIVSVGNSSKPTPNANAAEGTQRQILYVMVDPMGSQTQPSFADIAELPIPAAY